MADDASLPEPRSTGQRRFLRLGGLSSRLLLLTVMIVVVANVMILPPNLAAYQEQWLLDRLRAAELASRVADAAPNGQVTEHLSQQLLEQAEVVSVAIQADGNRRLVLQAPKLARTPYLIDLRENNPITSLAGPIQTLLGGGQRMVRVIARPRYVRGEFVEIVAPDGPLRKELLAQLGRLLGIAAFTSLMAGAVVFFSLNYLLVAPMQRITAQPSRCRRM